MRSRSLCDPFPFHVQRLIDSQGKCIKPVLSSGRPSYARVDLVGYKSISMPYTTRFSLATQKENNPPSSCCRTIPDGSLPVQARATDGGFTSSRVGADGWSLPGRPTVSATGSDPARPRALQGRCEGRLSLVPFPSAMRIFYFTSPSLCPTMQGGRLENSVGSIASKTAEKHMRPGANIHNSTAHGSW